jgi:hypothetical protein
MMSQRVLRSLLCLALVVAAVPLLAQQTGAIRGKVTDSSGAVLPGVTIEARSEVLPGPRTVVSGSNGDYRLPALPPGTYTVKFELSGMQTVTRKVAVQLNVESAVDAALAVGGVTEEVTVTASVSLIDKESPTIVSALSTDEIQGLPVAQEYRDLQKLIPGAMYTEDQTRGASVGGSGQDNVYQFDGANVNLPFYGTLASDAASYDIAQVTIVKGGARAVDFERSGGFSIDTVSKSGTAAFHGMLSFQLMDDSMVSDQEANVQSRYEQDRTWLNANLGGPILKDKLYFYGSYYRPEVSRANAANLYGELPDYESVRNEGFGKLTFTPTKDLLLNVSYRDSKTTQTGATFAAAASPTTGTGYETTLKIGTVEGSWVIGPKSFATVNYTHFVNENQGRPDYVADVQITSAPTPGTRIDIANLDQLGRLTVPTPIAGQDAYNAFVQPLIDRYGYTQDGVKKGGGIVGYGAQFDDQDFFRDGVQLGYNLTLGSSITHDLHFGYEWYKEREELIRSSNGWGTITVPGGRLSPPIAGNPQRAYYTAQIQQQSAGTAAAINSEFVSNSFELNDTIKWKNWAFNLGVLVSQDKLYGQGLREDSSTLSGYVAAPGNKYLMYTIPWEKMIQPRLGVNWAYNGEDTIYASFARYNPAASSLPRAASWDRNLTGTFIDVHFDQNGVVFGSVPVGSSSGKLFVEDMTPRTVDEYLVGTARQLTKNLSGRLYYRHRRGSNFWEDTNNNARIAFNPPADIPRELYIPDLDARRAQIGSGSTYVIAELDGAYTRYNEVTLEIEWRGDKSFVRGSYTWSEYYGNFDQDNSTVDNDLNIFIGSSNIADGAGRQLWDFKDGTLRGDRPHMFKIYGYRQVPWNATIGAFFVAQSGQPWETWNYEPYRALTTSTNETIKYAEPAGSRRSDSHYQMDLNYTQNIKVTNRFNFQIVADLFNVFDKQTGYSIEPRFHSASYGEPRVYFQPRRFQVAARILF